MTMRVRIMRSKSACRRQDEIDRQALLHIAQTEPELLDLMVAGDRAELPTRRFSVIQITVRSAQRVGTEQRACQPDRGDLSRHRAVRTDGWANSLQASGVTAATAPEMLRPRGYDSPTETPVVSSAGRICRH